MKNLLSYSVLFLGLALSACSSDNGDIPEPSKYINIPLTEQTRSSVDASNGFAFKLLGEFQQDAIASASDNEADVFFSPAGIFTNLAMLANGDKGAARDEILAALGASQDESGLALVNDYNNIMLTHLPKADNSSKCEFTTSFWYNPAKLTPNSEFASTLQDKFLASVFDTNPSGKDGMDKINAFVDNASKGMIRNFIESPFSDLDAAFLNTAYFKGIWADKFNANQTQEASFKKLDGSYATIPFMNKTEELQYSYIDGIEAVAIPFGNHNFELIGILPPKDSDFMTFVGSIDSLTWEYIIKGRHSNNVILSFPKFEAGQGLSLIPTLKKLGINEIFTNGLNAVSDESLIINVFLQKTRIVIDESGAEAASATMSGGEMLMPYPGTDVTLKFNRPFVYLIRETSTGAILFLGTKTK